MLQNLKKSLAKLADKIELDELDTDNENEDSQDKPGPSGIQNNSSKFFYIIFKFCQKPMSKLFSQ